MCRDQVTEGQTPYEVQASVQEALDALVEAWAELGRDIPPALRPFLADRPRIVEALVRARRATVTSLGDCESWDVCNCIRERAAIGSGTIRRQI